MKDISYASAVESLMYAQVCTRPDIAYTFEKLDRYLINSEIDYWKTVKKLMRYLQKTTWKSDQLQLFRYTDSDYARCIDNRKSTSGYIFLIAGRW